MTRNAFKAVTNVPLDSLMLDTRNPRIRAGVDEPDSIARLLRKPRQLLALAKDIADNGLSTAPILVEPQGKKFLVWDGNRRVTALKLLNDPAKCHDRTLQPQFASIAAKAKAPIPKTVDVQASSDKAALLKEVLARHAGALDGAGQLNWDALLRTMFQLGHTSATPEYRIAGLLLLWAEEHDIEVDDDFPITAIHRFLNKQNLEKLGFRDAKDHVEPIFDAADAVRVVERIIYDFGPGGYKTENVFTDELQQEYIHKLLVELGLAKAEKKKASGKANAGGTGTDASGTGTDGARGGDGGDDSDDTDAGGGGDTTSGARAKGRAKRKADWDRKSVVRTRYKPDIPEQYWKADDVLTELRKVVTKDYTLSAAALFRMFFEYSTRAYMKRHRIADTGAMNKNALAAAAHMRSHGRIDQGELEAANRRFKDKSQSEALLQYNTLNDYMHSLKHLPDTQSLHVLWTEVEAYLEACWDDARRPR